MVLGKSLIIIGIIISIFGTIFHFQGQGQVGPESSFMYANPEWITQGIIIAGAGIGIIISGIVVRFKRSL
ncbi:hypothetical protein C6988_02360 [Nitrosopumilus sp. b1]|uniref:hypothetical protein n=1 Tax=Nitrosopumilus sp. b1 TaxID=2109907 RepID=UPI0015F476CA|nr:hypothetical protein [Nitrosopumilus sp. b1]KAF6243676.1 hypothetical protein C6988_02360 [Nitrosopumilus sp. b1]